MEDIFRELLFLGKCHHSFLDKPYQELDFTRHLNSVLGRNTVRSADVSHDFISFICFCSRLCWSWKEPISILRLMKICVRFQYVPWKNVWLCFISIASVHFSHKIEVWMKRDFEEKKFIISGIAIYYCHFFDYFLINVVKTWLM